MITSLNINQKKKKIIIMNLLFTHNNFLKYILSKLNFFIFVKLRNKILRVSKSILSQYQLINNKVNKFFKKKK
jgi:hypothetical protein